MVLPEADGPKLGFGFDLLMAEFCREECRLSKGGSIENGKRSASDGHEGDAGLCELYRLLDLWKMLTFNVDAIRGE